MDVLTFEHKAAFIDNSHFISSCIIGVFVQKSLLRELSGTQKHVWLVLILHAHTMNSYLGLDNGFIVSIQ